MINVKHLITATWNQENTTIAKYRLVIAGTNAEDVVAGTSTTSPFLGVSDESADSTTNNPVGVVMLGIAKLVIASATTKGAAITGTTGGKGLATTTDNNHCVGYLLETTTESDQIAAVLVNPFMYGTI